MKRIFNVATYKRDECLFKTIDSIYNQADEINIALNSHDRIPDRFVNDSKINCFITDNSIGDGFKFLKLEDSDGYYFTIDDDLVYPPNYAEYMIAKFHLYGGQYIVSLHGRSFTGYPVASYYRSPHYNYHCLGNVDKDVFVHLGGSGVAMFHTNLLKFSHKDIKHPNMADIWLAKFANEKGIRIVCLEHKSNYLTYQAEVGEKTIFDEFKFNDKVQTDLMNTIKFA
ncbi:MAG: hypothetical protein WC333_01010 [Dehalococcoidia bacterium]|jgi:hypothetical protein